MPIYEYHCEKCNITFERFVSDPNSKEQASCSKCGSNNVKKVLSSCGFRMTSSGSTASGGLSGGCNSSSGFS